jgi:hypothetical protein
MMKKKMRMKKKLQKTKELPMMEAKTSMKMMSLKKKAKNQKMR